MWKDQIKPSHAWLIHIHTSEIHWLFYYQCPSMLSISLLLLQWLNRTIVRQCFRFQHEYNRLLTNVWLNAAHSVTINVSLSFFVIKTQEGWLILWLNEIQNVDIQMSTMLVCKYFMFSWLTELSAKLRIFFPSFRINSTMDVWIDIYRCLHEKWQK